jgi:formylglycine-generating enzyme required for sulfatase activity
MERQLSVFLCHASEDKPVVREIEGRLREDGFQPWLDERELLPGQVWPTEIRNALRRADAVVVCLSQTSVSKEGYLQKELREALKIAEEKPEGTVFIIPVKLSDCEIPERLAQWQWAAYYEKGGYERLVTALLSRAASIGLAAHRSSSSRVPSGMSRRWWLLLAGVVLLITAVAVIYGIRSRTGETQTDRNGGSKAANASSPPGMVSIPAATFAMGRNHPSFPIEGPAHKVTVRAFRLDSQLVSNRDYRRFVESTGYFPPAHWRSGAVPPGQEDLPVTNVSWRDAQAFCTWSGKRLPTEAEWEYAARGADSRLYPWGNSFESDLTNSLESGVNSLMPPGHNLSPLEVQDMSGNVWQWCADDFQAYPGARLQLRIPKGAKVLRGGSFRSDRNHVTTTVRNLERPSVRSDEIGFRCAQ